MANRLLRAIVPKPGFKNDAREEELSGVTPVAPKPRYHEPISVNLPPLLRKAALAPTLELLERKAPKYEYRPM